MGIAALNPSYFFKTSSLLKRIVCQA